ncbi:hypothetical protein BGZ74_007517, partial [Mortierella antarctica]
STDIGIFYNKWKRSQARDLGFADRTYWFDRDRRSSLPANMGRNMSLVWSPRRTAGIEPAPEQAQQQAQQQAPEVVTEEEEEEDEVMEEGQAAGYDAPNVPSGSHGASDSSGSTQPVWTMENDIATDMELLPARRTGMRLRSHSRLKRSQGSGDATSSNSSSSDAPRYDPGSPSLGWRGSGNTTQVALLVVGISVAEPLPDRDDDTPPSECMTSAKILFVACCSFGSCKRSTPCIAAFWESKMLTTAARS